MGAECFIQTAARRGSVTGRTSHTNCDRDPACARDGNPYASQLYRAGRGAAAAARAQGAKRLRKTVPALPTYRRVASTGRPERTPARGRLACKSHGFTICWPLLFPIAERFGAKDEYCLFC
ncbi:hypothetical protein EVAR_97956_1 [Eumeta japonica]|uniref:Uncharacterized protein n=1 Tax=Eumeta variegata TaxID=151549 RepID=A0A4C1XI17_EUMVA|nr:hypothetical protein EVAR_97956_1 [Eumeta japonica]